MFSKGQLIFALVFFISFVVGIAIAYKNDKVKNKKMFEGSYKVLLFVVLVFFALFFLVKMKRYFLP